MRAAAHLDIPFISLNLSEEYRKEVGESFIEEYRKGRTPNPDVLCNRAIKFGGFAAFARKNGADCIATGHYAQIHEVDGAKYLARGKDTSKDQSYFLWMLTEEDLAFALFPVGHLQKDEVRAEARKRGLPQASRKDSQGICFLGAIDLPEFLSHFIVLLPGKVLDASGRTIGAHQGAVAYTLGERHGFTVTDPTLRAEPLYVYATDVQENTITVGPYTQIPQRTVCRLSAAHIQDRALKGEVDGVLRYHGSPTSCVISKKENEYTVHFMAPVRVAKGQSLVLYQGDLLVGGGIVEA
jgi:tRNA-specific 2-thiouridylase